MPCHREGGVDAGYTDEAGEPDELRIMGVTHARDDGH